MFLGIDAADSSTHICMINQAKEIVFEDHLATCNFYTNTLEEITPFLKNIIKQHPSVQSIVIGIAGWMNTKEQFDFTESLSAYFPKKRIETTSAAFLGLLKFQMKGPCITLISDLNASALGYRTDGNLFTIEPSPEAPEITGSGHGISAQAIKESLEQLSAGNITSLYKAAHKHFGTESLSQLTEKQGNAQDMYSFTKVVNQLALAGDACALSCIRNAANALLKFVDIAIKNNNLPSSGFNVGFHGRCLNKSSALAILLEEELTRLYDANLHESKQSASQSAALRALQYLTPTEPHD
ncbi:hypothetical protein [Litoribacillus peritrichatus]|uniref:ATPase BadF/BadG/BcrA/BcrD type domain-containing protein n=1 Tax=Litoribacillus peritrichatus TaxID=718191 RepID=A0ABP7N1X9_9GAMM